MSISIDWYDPEKSVIQVIFDGVWTIEEFIETIKEVNTFNSDGLNAHEQVSLIVNLEKSAGIPRGMSVLPHFRYALTKLDFQYMIIAGGTSFGITLTRLVTNAIPDKNRKIFFEADALSAAKRIESLRETISN